MGINARILCVVVFFLLVAVQPLSGQGYRAEVSVGGSFVQLRPLERDSLASEEVPGEAIRRRLADGTVVTCIPGDFCRWYRSGDVQSVSRLVQEMRVAAWPGVRGLSGHAHLRGRLGSEEWWPRTGQRVEAVAAYLSYDRERFRVRAGRQLRWDGLGMYNFDGISLLWRGPRALRVEAYGGWSLARGTNAPLTGSLLKEAEAIPPDRGGLLLGVVAGGSLGSRLSGRATYQREIRTDRLALYAERVAADARALIGEVAVDLSAEYDLAYREVNEARLRVSAPIAAGVEVTAQGRHHTPFFELWTIWGAFDPVGFNEGRAALVWSVLELPLTLEVGGAYRRYEATDAGAGFLPLKDGGWRAYGRAQWGGREWFADGTYRAETGFGAVRYGGDVALGRRFGPGTYVTLRGSSTQTFGEFRFGEQFTSGGSLDGSLQLGEVALVGGIGVYRLSFENRPRVRDWTQLRAGFGVSYRFGTDLGPRGSGSYRP